ncbi:MAG: FliM/FliN family flagellar motor switch protein [Candidatus Krumholzibacteria bacterium]|nr:FliM/FliN family flagellar motor switch protein [Candidatus Krumholzibacteria bacterium]
MTSVDLEQPTSDISLEHDLDLDAAIDAAEDLAGNVDGGLGIDLDDVLNASSEEEDHGDVPEKYDFHRPHHISRPFQKNLQAVAEYFAKNGTIDFTSRLRMATDVEYQGLRQCTYAEFLRELPKPTCAAMVDFAPLKGPSLLNLDLGLCFVFMKKLLGGKPEPEMMIRDFTEIERAIATDLVGRFVEMFGKAISKIVAVESGLSGLENNPHYLSGISEGSSLVVLEFKIKLDAVEGPIQWAMPLSSFGPVREIFDPSDVKETRNSAELKGDRRKILNMVQGSGSELVVQLGQFETNLENILNLSTGDLLDLPQAVEAPLKIQIAGRDAWLGEAGRVGNLRAISLIQQLNKE